MTKEVQQILRAMKNRLDGLAAEAKQRQRFGNKQQMEELIQLVAMLEQRLDPRK